jgi:hypothetical protein
MFWGCFCAHHQEYIKSVDAITGTSHVSVWCRFKSVERYPRSEVYFTFPWENNNASHISGSWRRQYLVFIDAVSEILPLALVSKSLPDSIQQCPSWKGNGSYSSQEFPCTWGILKVHHSVHNSQLLVPILSHVNPLQETIVFLEHLF